VLTHDWTKNGGRSKAYEFISRQAPRRLFEIADVLSKTHENIYIDPWHLGPQGNRLVAQRIFAVVRQSILQMNSPAIGRHSVHAKRLP
jgi:hypothetical protein